MARNLEDFLQQAAERLAEQVSGQPQRQTQPQTPPPVRQAERAGVRRQDDEEVMEAVLIDDGPDPLSTLDTRHLPEWQSSPLAQDISQRDERMEARVHGSLDHDIVELREASSALKGLPKPNISDHAESSVKRREKDVSPLINMLRNPESLRAAYLLSIIFERREH